MSEMKTVYLWGDLADWIPDGKLTADFNSARTATSAIEANWPGFKELIRNRHLEIWYEHEGQKYSIGEDKLFMKIGADNIHISPVIEGSGGRTGKVILGVALFAAGAVASGGTLSGFGAAAFGNSLGITAGQLIISGGLMVLNGLFAPQAPKGDFGKNEEERKPSAIYRGPLNTQEQGIAFPLVFGFGVIAGGSVIHVEIDSADVPV